MVDNKSKDEISVRTTDSRDIYDTLKDNYMRAVDEVAKVHPQYSQSISNLQLDYIQTMKNLVHAGISAQRQIMANWSIPIPSAYSEQISKHSSEITNNAIRAVGINNQLTLNSLEAARENLKIYNRTVDAITEFNNNVGKAWNSFFTAQQNFFRQ